LIYTYFKIFIQDVHLIKKAALIIFLISAIYIYADNNFSFVVIGDTRPPIGTNDSTNFETLIKRMNQLNPDFIINLGDMIYGYGSSNDDSEWQSYLKITQSIKSKYYQVPGNHDIHNIKAEKTYQEKFKKLYY
jgi:phosphodiesterase/alkaline phosphatase D-like protein